LLIKYDLRPVLSVVEGLSPKGFGLTRCDLSHCGETQTATVRPFQVGKTLVSPEVSDRESPISKHQERR
jgi:hypothetical protein